ncbi:MAG: hypothetical protein LBF39_02945 [Prevotellaceae bacterium]|jgi:4-hydroxybenzoate polyprenyltransferase|nr:hypothetical protein [Prevotellaceae bacterium]
MKTKTLLFSRLFFILTLAFYTTACIIFGIILLAMDSLDTFLDQNAFNSLLYWTIVIVATAWYSYFYGFPKTQDVDGAGKGTYPVLFALSTPVFIGVGIGVVIYYILYALSVLFLASIGYIVTLLLIVSLFYVTWFLIGLYFKPDEKISPTLQKTIMSFSLIVAFGFLLLSLYVLLFRA